ncbi:MAG: hypothetical protein N3G20_07550, partial [Verrucomicrobiae bacterium]|nr:hypothetical protein [Verrucomicrobiae bacterium]
VPEPPVITNVHLDKETSLTIELPDIEGVVELWVSEDLVGWTRIDAPAWSLSNNRITVDLGHPSLHSAARSFFKVRVGD